MKAYSYNSITKEYKAEVNCQLDPLETKKQQKNIYLLPAGATLIKPPICATNKIAVYENDIWIKKDDYRGTYYDKTTKEQQIIDELDLSPDRNWTKKIPLAIDDTCKWSSTKWIIDSVKVVELEKITQKEILIQAEIRKQAIDKLIIDGVLDSQGELA